MEESQVVISIVQAVGQVGISIVFVWWAYRERLINLALVQAHQKQAELTEKRKIAALHVEYAKLTGGRQIPGTALETDIGET